MVCLGNKQRSFCHFWYCIQVLHFRLFCWLWWLRHFFKGFLPTIVYIMVIWFSPILVHFSLLIPKMLMFPLDISCLTTSNLPWFMNVTFQVPMQHCSLQHRTLLPSPVTSTTGYCFCFGFISSFFLELFLRLSPVAYWAPTDLGSSSFSVLSLPFHTVHWPQPCLTQWNYEPCHERPPKTDGSWWRVLTKCGLREKATANHFSILALRTPWTQILMMYLTKCNSIYATKLIIWAGKIVFSLS